MKACNGRAIVFSFLCFNLIKALIFLSYNFSIFIVIIELVLPLFKFVFGPSHLGLGELEVPLVMSIRCDVCGLGATCYMLSMD